MAAPRVAPGVAELHASPGVGDLGSSEPLRGRAPDAEATAPATLFESAYASGPRRLDGLSTGDLDRFGLRGWPWTGDRADLRQGFAPAPDLLPASPLHRISSPSVFVCGSSASVSSPSHPLAERALSRLHRTCIGRRLAGQYSMPPPEGAPFSLCTPDPAYLHLPPHHFASSRSLPSSISQPLDRPSLLVSHEEKSARWSAPLLASQSPSMPTWMPPTILGTSQGRD